MSAKNTSRPTASNLSARLQALATQLENTQPKAVTQSTPNLASKRQAADAVEMAE